MRNTVDVTKLADNRGSTVEFKSSSEQTAQSLSSGNKQFHLELKPFRSSPSSSEVASGLYPHDRHHQAYRSDAAVSVSPPVSAADLEQSLQLLRLDIHQEVQEIVREQMRQFAIAKVCIYVSTVFSSFMQLQLCVSPLIMKRVCVCRMILPLLFARCPSRWLSYCKPTGSSGRRTSICGRYTDRMTSGARGA
jgi:hypothetical protein